MSDLSVKISIDVNSRRDVELLRRISNGAHWFEKFIKSTIIIRREISDLQFFTKDGKQYSCGINFTNHSLDGILENKYWGNHFKVFYNDLDGSSATESLYFGYDQITGNFSISPDGINSLEIAENFIRSLMSHCYCKPNPETFFNLENIDNFIGFLRTIENSFKLFYYNLADREAPSRIIYDRYMSIYNNHKYGFMDLLVEKLPKLIGDNDLTIERSNEFVLLLRYLRKFNLLPTPTGSIDKKDDFLRKLSAASHEKLIRLIKFCEDNRENLSDPCSIDEINYDSYWQFLVLFSRQVVFHELVSKPYKKKKFYHEFDQWE